jgi:hypothetical protein
MHAALRKVIQVSGYVDNIFRDAQVNCVCGSPMELYVCWGLGATIHHSVSNLNISNQTIKNNRCGKAFHVAGQVSVELSVGIPELKIGFQTDFFETLMNTNNSLCLTECCSAFAHSIICHYE